MRSKFAEAIYMILGILLASCCISAQGNEISEAEFDAARSSGLSATFKVFPRREIQTIERFEAGKEPKVIKITTVYGPGGRLYVVTEEKSNGRVDVAEVIQIGSDLYCRENGEQWTINDTGCYLNPPPPKINAKPLQFRMEKTGNDGSRYSRLAEYGGRSGTEAITFVLTDNIDLNKDSTMSSRTIVTTLKSSGSVVSRNTYQFEYGAMIDKIEPPIK